jgi:hypothetical protein
MNGPTRPDGFRHNGLIVYAVQYELESAPPSWLIVWLDGRGNSVRRCVRPAEPERRMVTVRPGDTLLHYGKPHRVAGVSVYRALSEKPGRELVG